MEDEEFSMKIPISALLPLGKQRMTISVETSWEGFTGMVAIGPITTTDTNTTAGKFSSDA